MGTPCCEICSASVAKGASLYRVNPKGQPGIWRCIEHMDKLPDPELRQIVEAVSERPENTIAPPGWRWNPRNGNLERIQ